MQFLRTLAATLLCLFLLDSSAQARGASGGASGSSEGTFAGIEQGDYAHFLIKDKQGKPASFIILRPDASVESFIKNEAKLKGRKIRVHWKEEKIPQAGNERMKTIVKVEQRTK